jgi:putative transposase
MCIFGMVDAAEMRLSEIGRTVDSCWKEIPKHFQVSLDQWIVMPNHLHGIIIMADETPLATADALPVRPALGAIVGAFKSAATKARERRASDETVATLATQFLRTRHPQ